MMLRLLEQGDVVAALGKTALSSLVPRPKARADVPGPWIERTVPPRSWGLVRDYVKHVGGDPWAYVAALPPHLFPQWSFPLAARTLEGLPHPLARVLNAGCRIESRKPIPLDEPLHVRARLESIDDDGKRAILVQRVITSTRSAEDAQIAEIRAFVPLRPPEKGEKKSPSETAANDATPIATLDLERHAGRDFAVLTGDVNPIHWLPAYAKLSGLRGTILHGFATLARAFEAIVRERCDRDPARLRTIDVRFRRPLVLPAKVEVLVSRDRVWVADRAGAPAYLAGTFATEPSR